MPHILAAWDSLDDDERFLFNKLITGGFRMGVSQGLMTRALAQATGIEETLLAHRLMGDWTPGRTSFAALIQTNDGAGEGARPYPFALAAPLEDAPESLGLADDWLAEWKWDGIRGQLIHRRGAFALWSRGEELITDRFPEFATLARFPAPRHRDRRRGPGLGRGRTTSLRGPSKAHRSQDGAQKAAGRGACPAAGLRSARTGRRRPSRRTARRAAGETGAGRSPRCRPGCRSACRPPCPSLTGLHWPKRGPAPATGGPRG